MTSHRKRLPQLDGGLFLTDGGIETSLIYNDGLELPHFAAFDLFRRPGGEAALRATSARTPGLPIGSAPASFSKARPGARARTGASASATRGTI